MKIQPLFLLIASLLIFSSARADGSFFCYKGVDCPSRFCSRCQCTDLGRYRNDCMTDRRYCEAFGNIGAR